MTQTIIDEYHTYLNAVGFPCAGAKVAQAKRQIRCLVAGELGSDLDDATILQFLYDFIDEYRNSENIYYSAAVIFRESPLTEEVFDELMWQRLQALHDRDILRYSSDKRVDNDPFSPNFSYSLKEEALFIIGMHAESCRLARRFKYPTLAFNPHEQFQKLRSMNRYESLKDIIRRRDIAYSGSVNSMLDDFGGSSEVYQYSGRRYDNNWKCPLIINHGKTKYNTPS